MVSGLRLPGTRLLVPIRFRPFNDVSLSLFFSPCWVEVRRLAFNAKMPVVSPTGAEIEVQEDAAGGLFFYFGPRALRRGLRAELAGAVSSPDKNMV